MTKPELKKLINAGRWNKIGEFFNFVPAFLFGPSGRKCFDWRSCPPEMTAILQSETSKTKQRIAKYLESLPWKLVSHRAQNGLCYYCRQPTLLADWTKDHVVPRSKGGGGGDNIKGACIGCNSAKRAMSEEAFMKSEYIKKKLLLAVKQARAMTNQKYSVPELVGTNR